MCSQTLQALACPHPRCWKLQSMQSEQAGVVQCCDSPTLIQLICLQAAVRNLTAKIHFRLKERVQPTGLCLGWFGAPRYNNETLGCSFFFEILWNVAVLHPEGKGRNDLGQTASEQGRKAEQPCFEDGVNLQTC